MIQARIVCDGCGLEGAPYFVRRYDDTYWLALQPEYERWEGEGSPDDLHLCPRCEEALMDEVERSREPLRDVLERMTCDQVRGRRIV